MARAERRREIHHDPHPAGAAAADGPAALGCSTAILGRRDQLHRRLAYVPGEVNLWPQLTGGEVIDLLGRLRGGTNRARRDEMLQRFELDPTKKGTAYSKGQGGAAGRRWLATWNSSSSTSQPSGWILMEEVFAECIQAERQRGRTVLLSSHILSEVEALCDRVSIIRNGRNVETGTLAEMRHVTTPAST